MSTFTTPHETVVIQSAAATRVTSVAAAMALNAGYDIVSADSIDSACQRVAAGGVELLILAGERAEMEAALDRLATLPRHDRPSHVAILSDDTDGDALLNRKVPGTQVHLFVTPLQAYGLLSVVRRIRRHHMHAN